MNEDQKAFVDQLKYGQSFMLDGKRIDPKDIYMDEPQLAAAHLRRLHTQNTELQAEIQRLKEIIDEIENDDPPIKQELVFDITAAVDAAMVEMKNMHPPMRRSECERLIKAALYTVPPSKPEQTPVAYVYDGDLFWHEHVLTTYAAEMHKQDLFTAPVSKPWVSLTDEQIHEAFCNTPNLRQLVSAFKAGALWAEASLKGKNNG